MITISSSASYKLNPVYDEYMTESKKRSVDIAARIAKNLCKISNEYTYVDGSLRSRVNQINKLNKDLSHSVSIEIRLGDEDTNDIITYYNSNHHKSKSFCFELSKSIKFIDRRNYQVREGWHNHISPQNYDHVIHTNKPKIDLFLSKVESDYVGIVEPFSMLNVKLIEDTNYQDKFIKNLHLFIKEFREEKIKRQQERLVKSSLAVANARLI